MLTKFTTTTRPMGWTSSNSVSAVILTFGRQLLGWRCTAPEGAHTRSTSCSSKSIVAGQSCRSARCTTRFCSSLGARTPSSSGYVGASTGCADGGDLPIGDQRPPSECPVDVRPGPSRYSDALHTDVRNNLLRNIGSSQNGEVSYAELPVPVGHHREPALLNDTRPDTRRVAWRAVCGLRTGRGGRFQGRPGRRRCGSRRAGARRRRSPAEGVRPRRHGVRHWPRA